MITPHRTTAQGVIRPPVLITARAVQDAGWRVSSIIRPQGTHALGISLDVCPMTYHVGGFGPKTAQLLWRVAKEAQPNMYWMALAEPDHIHLQLFSQDILGVQYPGVPRTWYNPITRKQVPTPDLSRIMG